MAPLCFDLPFITDDAYLDLLLEHEDRVGHLYFGLGLPDFPDARPWQQSPAGSLEELCEKLALFPNTRRQVLLNGRITDPRVYLEKEALKPLLSTLEILVARGLVQGLVLSDLYLAQTLTDAEPELCAALSASPSINCRIDAAEKAVSWLDRLVDMGFQPATLLILDRWLNRSLKKLAELTQKLRGPYPVVEICLLANEGCLYRCPLRQAHEVLIGSCRDNEERFQDLGRLHSVRGCARRFFEYPWELLKSPFIRPEDLSSYEGAGGLHQALRPDSRHRTSHAYCPCLF